jgi:LysR family transcriptional regulator, glycine cleavage system transcriptional activator
LKRSRIPSISGLTSFVAAAEYESFTRAADELNLSQGAVSRQIRELEGQLGIRLFERVRQRVVLTEAGKRYLSYVKKPLDELAVASRKVEEFSDGTILNLAVVPAFATRWLLPRMPSFQKKHPKIMVHVTPRQRPIDFAVEPFDAEVHYDPTTSPDTLAYHLIDMDLVPVCSPLLEAGTVVKTPEDIVKFPLLHKMSRPKRWSEWMAAAGVTLEQPPRGQAYPQLSMLADAAVAGLGIALLPPDLFIEEFADNRLEIVPNQSSATKLSIYLIAPEARAGCNTFRIFADWLIAEAEAAAAKPCARRKVAMHV